jgi:hypothetical protein
LANVNTFATIFQKYFPSAPLASDLNGRSTVDFNLHNTPGFLDRDRVPVSDSYQVSVFAHHFHGVRFGIFSVRPPAKK